MKKLIAAALLCALVLSGCTPASEPGTTAPPTDTTTAPPTTQPVEQSKPWDRADVIDRNLTVEGSWADTGVWAMQWAKDCLPEAAELTLQSEFAEGFVLTDGCLEEGWSAGISTWRVFSDTGFETKVQLLHYTEGQTTALSGVFTPEEALSTQADVYTELQKDSRIALRLRAFPKTELSDNVSELRLTQFGAVNGQQSMPVGDGALAVLDVAYAGAEGTWSLYVIDAKHETLTKKEELGVLNYAVMERAEGGVLVSLFRADGEERRLYKADGSFKAAEPKTGEYRLPGGRMIIERDGSLFAKNTATNEEKLLVEGLKSEDERVKDYRFFAAIDEEWFVYYGWGYEFPIAGGICNSVTGEIRSYDLAGEDRVRTPVLYADGKLYTLPLESGVNPIPAVTDVKTGETRHLVRDNGLDTSRIINAAFSPDGTRTAVLLMDEVGAYQVAVYDSQSGAKTVQASLKTPFCSIDTLQFMPDGGLLASGSRHVGSESAVYLIAPEKK